ncbi:MAG: carboxypeptidase-like regulatory domain-containing protein [Marinilabilia sp.]
MLLLLVAGCEDTIDSSLTGTLSGRVLDKAEMMPLEGVRISTNPYSEVTETDSNGVFVLEDVKEGEYNVIASMNGYKSESLTVNVNFEETTDVELVMAKSVAAGEALKFTDVFTPVDEEVLNQLMATFSWQMEEDDSLSYDLILFESGNSGDPLVYENLTDTFKVVEGLRFSTNYLWQVRAKSTNDDVYSEVRQFRTPSLPSNQIMFSEMTDEVLQLFVADSLMEAPVQVSYNKHHSWNARVNHQKTAIAFQSSRDVESRLYVMNMDGSGMRRLTDFQTGGYFHHKIEYDWAPNGSHLIFTSYENLYRINADGTGLEVIATAPDDKHFREVAYSPDGEDIYTIVLGNHVLDRRIFRMDGDGSNMSLLYEDPGHALAHLDVSPDRRSLLFSKDVSGYVSTTGRLLDARIFELDIQEGTVEDLSQRKESGTNDLQAVYSPNGGRIVFVNSLNTLTATPSLWMMDVSGDHRSRIRVGGQLPYWFE